MSKKYKTIPVSKETYDKLDEVREPDLSWDGLINNILESALAQDQDRGDDAPAGAPAFDPEVLRKILDVGGIREKTDTLEDRVADIEVDVAEIRKIGDIKDLKNHVLREVKIDMGFWLKGVEEKLDQRYVIRMARPVPVPPTVP